MSNTPENSGLTSDCVIDQLPIPYLHDRNGMFYYKRKVPAKLGRQLVWPKEQVWIALGTSDIGTAIPLCQAQNLAFEQAMNDAKFELEAKSAEDVRALRLLKGPQRGKGTTKYLLPEHIPFLIERHAYAQHKTLDAARRNASRQVMQELRRAVTQSLDACKQHSQTMNYAAVDGTASALLCTERLIAPPGSHVRASLLTQLLAAEVQILQEQLRHLDGEAYCPMKEPIAPRAMPTMLDAFNEWRKKRAQRIVIRQDKPENSKLAECAIPRTATLRTVESYRKFVDEFESVCGALPTQAITVSIASKYRDHLIEGGLLRRTVQNHFGALAIILRAATVGEEKVQKNSAKNVFDFVDLEAALERPEQELRKAYDASELHALFQSPIYTQNARPSGQASESAYWAPILGPFAGLRLEEVAQLRVDDVQRIGEHWTLRIANHGPDQHLKTPNSFRLVPIHIEIIQCGFLAYVAKQKLAGHQRVFPSQCNNNKHRRWSNALGKWFSHYLDSIGLDDERLCYHSFRYSFSQACSEAEVPEDVRDALMGHWLTKMLSK